VSTAFASTTTAPVWSVTVPLIAPCPRNVLAAGAHFGPLAPRRSARLPAWRSAASGGVQCQLSAGCQRDIVKDKVGEVDRRHCDHISPRKETGNGIFALGIDRNGKSRAPVPVSTTFDPLRSRPPGWSPSRGWSLYRRHRRRLLRRTHDSPISTSADTRTIRERHKAQNLALLNAPESYALRMQLQGGLYPAVTAQG